jgi:hypothetical protein
MLYKQQPDRCLLSLLSRYQSNMTQTDVPADMKEFIEKYLSQMCHQLTSVVDDRFTVMKRELSAENSANLNAITSKKSRLDKHVFKSKGNEQQYLHQIGLLDTFEGAITALECHNTDKAMSLLQEGQAAIHGRIKLIKLADQSAHGWQTVAEYVTNELAENSEDEKRIDRAERTAEKKAKKKANAVANSLRPSFPRPTFPSYNIPLGNQVGPCYKLSIVFEFISVSHCCTFHDCFVLTIECVSSNKRNVLQATLACLCFIR